MTSISDPARSAPIRHSRPAGDSLPHDARLVLALAIWMATWWMTEAVPLSVTSLLPIVILPSFSSLGFGAVPVILIVLLLAVL